MTPSGDPDAPLYVPAEFEAQHLDEARRKVAASNQRRWIGRPTARGRQAHPPRRRIVLGVALVHVLAAVLAVVFALVTSTWEVGLFVVALTGVSAVVVSRLAVKVYERALEGPHSSGDQ